MYVNYFTPLPKKDQREKFIRNLRTLKRSIPLVLDHKLHCSKSYVSDSLAETPSAGRQSLSTGHRLARWLNPNAERKSAHGKWPLCAKPASLTR